MVKRLVFSAWVALTAWSWLVAAASAQGPVVGGQDIALWITSPTAIFLGAVISGIVEVAKRNGFPDNLSPLLAVGLGILGGLGYVQFYGSGIGWRPEVGDVLLRGLVLGLIAGGVFAFTKAAGKVFSNDENVHGQPVRERRQNP